MTNSGIITQFIDNKSFFVKILQIKRVRNVNILYNTKKLNIIIQK